MEPDQARAGIFEIPDGRPLVKIDYFLESPFMRFLARLRHCKSGRWRW